MDNSAGPDLAGGNSYNQEALEKMKVGEIKALAESLGYTIAATRKADIIAEFLAREGL